jgi:hypothetical protein
VNHSIHNEEEARELLKRLEQYYGQPVLPLGSFCRAMKVWMDCIVKNNTDPVLLEAGADHGKRYFSLLKMVYIDIRKSNLLSRLLYAKEPLRSRMCPIHKGHWSGDAMFFNKCPELCDGTGWLRERPGDEGFTGIKIVEIQDPGAGKPGE